MPWAAAVAAAASIGGALITSKSNKDAAKTASKANKDAADIANEGIDKQIAALKEGIAEGDQYYGQTREAAQPGVQYLRNVIATPGSLTPEQLAEREDLMRRVTNSSQVAGSALRGSGRSFVDAMRAIEGDYTNKALAINKARADSAASQFTQPYFNSLGNQAGAHATLGREVGGAIAGQAENSANALLGGANAKLQASQNNGDLWGNTIGQVGSEIASTLKNQSTPRGQFLGTIGGFDAGGGYTVPDVTITPRI